jgi:hypothetical protein
MGRRSPVVITAALLTTTPQECEPTRHGERREPRTLKQGRRRQQAQSGKSAGEHGGIRGEESEKKGQEEKVGRRE